MTYLEALKKILIEAGEILIELQNNIKSEIKFDNTWLTDADLKIEEFLKLELSRIEPKATFLGEESQDAESCLMWVVDPIDGTKAYKQGLEDYAIAVSLVKEDSPVMGAVYRPAQEQLFFAERGKGTYLIHNGEKNELRVSGKQDISKCTFVYGYRNKEPMLTVMKDIFENIITPLVEHRYVKSPASGGICDVARGCVDILMMPGVGKWDISGSILILEEAGGEYSNFLGEKSMEGPSLLGTNGVVHAKIIDLIADK